MKIIKKIKKVIISTIMIIMLLPQKIFATAFDPNEIIALYGPPELINKPTLIETV